MLTSIIIILCIQLERSVYLLLFNNMTLTIDYKHLIVPSIYALSCVQITYKYQKCFNKSEKHQHPSHSTSFVRLLIPVCLYTCFNIIQINKKLIHFCFYFIPNQNCVWYYNIK